MFVLAVSGVNGVNDTPQNQHQNAMAMRVILLSPRAPGKTRWRLKNAAA
jgi:hypothetical protein